MSVVSRITVVTMKKNNSIKIISGNAAVDMEASLLECFVLNTFMLIDLIGLCNRNVHWDTISRFIVFSFVVSQF